MSEASVHAHCVQVALTSECERALAVSNAACRRVSSCFTLLDDSPANDHKKLAMPIFSCMCDH